jgi:hypothetical protein
MRHSNQLLLALCCILWMMSIGCKQGDGIKETTSFYYWKTTYKLNAFEKNYVQTNAIKKIYLRCFDVVPTQNGYSPEAVMLWQDEPLQKVLYIPTVFIRNEIWQAMDSAKTNLLSTQVIKLCTQIMAAKKLPMQEIQIDCDWTASTQQMYFYFLACMAKQKIIVSNTLRLYQYKYRKDAGIAPTNYASLMCYNMGNLKSAAAQNSIINQADLAAYIDGQSPYPKPINIAMPIFHWALVYHGNQFKNILYNMPNTQNDCWVSTKENQFICVKDYLDTISNQYFYKQETIRLEKIKKQEWISIKNYLHEHLINQQHEIIYFDLDSTNICNYLLPNAATQ